MKKYKARIAGLLVGGLLAGMASPATAVVIDFDAFALGTVITNQIPEFTVTPAAGTVVDVVVGGSLGSSAPNGIVNRSGDFSIDFTVAVNSLSFTTGGENTASFGIDVSHQGGLTSLVFPFDGNSLDADLRDLSAFTGITSLFFDTDLSGPDMIVFDTFTFDVASTPLPEPTVPALLGLTLICFARLRYRRPVNTTNLQAG